MENNFAPNRLLLHLCFVIYILGSVAFAGPLNIESPNAELTNNSLAEPSVSVHRSGCRYKATVYLSGDNVPTDEPCLFCHCKGSVVICKLRICPEVPDPPPPGCIVLQKANKCCSQLICHDNHSVRKLSREQRLPGENETIAITPAVSTLLADGNSCVHDGTVYAEGSAMRASTLCQHCFCIRGQMTCSKPQCVIPMNGCKPRYRSYACCPTNYDCNQSNGTAILKTIPSSTPIPQFLKGCRVGGRFVAEGQPILPMHLAIGHRNNSDMCQTCFCMGGVVHCRPLECDRPIQGCRPVVEHGHCCPDRYECDEIESTTIPIVPTSDNDTSMHMSTSRQNGNEITPKILSMRARKEDNDAEVTTAYPNSEDETEISTLILVSTSPRPAETQVAKKKTRISTTSVGGFKNRSEGGSREERRNKDRVEHLSRSFYEDDAREDTSSSSLESSRQSNEQSSVFFDEPTDQSSSNSDTDDSSNSEAESTAIPTGASEIQDESGTESSNKIESTLPNENTKVVTENTLQDDNPKMTTDISLLSDSKQNLVNSDLKNGTEKITVISTTTKSLLSSSEKPVGSLEFIPFGMEDAVHSPMNETRYEIYPGQVASLPSYDTAARHRILIPPTLPNSYMTLKPLKLQAQESAPVIDNSSLSMEDLVPIIVEKDDLRNAIMDVPVQTSLYNNGYYNQGLVIEDPARKDDELIITQAEMDEPSTSYSSSAPPNTRFHGHIYNENGDSGNIGLGEAVPDTVPTQRSTVYPTEVTKQPSINGPLKGLSSSQNFIPSYSPITPPPEDKNETDENPSRTYSKFGVQDSSYYRYGYPGGFTPNNPSEVDHQIYNYNPEAEGAHSFEKEVANNKESPQGRLRYNSNPFQPYEDPFVYEDASEEFSSFENFFGPKTTQAPLRNRYGAPYTGPVSFNPVPLISSSGSTVSLSSKTKTTKKPATITQIVNSKPMRRPKPMVEDQHLDSSDPLGFKPVVAFPFTIPKSQNNYNMGLKLSGCNIYGKMYGVGQVIHELSSICVQCQCTEVGVQCSELQC